MNTLKQFILSLILGAFIQSANGTTVIDSFPVREVELIGYEGAQEEIVLLTVQEPLFRCGQILRLGDKYVVPVNKFFTGGQWFYMVVFVQVGNKPNGAGRADKTMEGNTTR